ncbi:hypothetical protein ARMGADRAFT_1039838 [Armillaria gallica]|uniref:Uncharacterized protein n=1 Tax=Armillaria gallica TaxID=47427 RepID=A0A2H3CQH7_ARMGA|nr:hypothetical protein ARMGADRAFT_1039838 [Armillaria gallica]
MAEVLTKGVGMLYIHMDGLQVIVAVTTSLGWGKRAGRWVVRSVRWWLACKGGCSGGCMGMQIQGQHTTTRASGSLVHTRIMFPMPKNGGYMTLGWLGGLGGLGQANVEYLRGRQWQGCIPPLDCPRAPQQSMTAATIVIVFCVIVVMAHLAFCGPPSAKMVINIQSWDVWRSSWLVITMGSSGIVMVMVTGEIVVLPPPRAYAGQKALFVCLVSVEVRGGVGEKEKKSRTATRSLCRFTVWGD